MKRGDRVYLEKEGWGVIKENIYDLFIKIYFDEGYSMMFDLNELIWEEKVNTGISLNIKSKEVNKD